MKGLPINCSPEKVPSEQLLLQSSMLSVSNKWGGWHRRSVAESSRNRRGNFAGTSRNRRGKRFRDLAESTQDYDISCSKRTKNFDLEGPMVENVEANFSKSPETVKKNSFCAFPEFGQRNFCSTPWVFIPVACRIWRWM